MIQHGILIATAAGTMGLLLPKCSMYGEPSPSGLLTDEQNVFEKVGHSWE